MHIASNPSLPTLIPIHTVFHDYDNAHERIFSFYDMLKVSELAGSHTMFSTLDLYDDGLCLTFPVLVHQISSSVYAAVSYLLFVRSNAWDALENPCFKCQRLVVMHEIRTIHVRGHPVYV